MIQTKYCKTGKTHRYVISAPVRVGERAEGFKSCQYYPSDYEGLEVAVRSGRVVEAYKRAKSNLGHGIFGRATSVVELPEYVKQDPRVKAWLDRCQEDLRQSCLDTAERALKAEEAVEITLREKGDEWGVVEKPTQCWLEWATGKVWWTPVAGAGCTPQWAMALRGLWDSAWS